jgi:hypothetical protein
VETAFPTHKLETILFQNVLRAVRQDVMLETEIGNLSGFAGAGRGVRLLIGGGDVD